MPLRSGERLRPRIRLPKVGASANGRRRRGVAEYANQWPKRYLATSFFLLPKHSAYASGLFLRRKAREPRRAAGDPQVPPVSRCPASAEPSHPCYCSVRLVWFAGSIAVAGERSGLSSVVVHGRFAGSGHPVRRMCDPERSVVVLQPAVPRRLLLAEQAEAWGMGGARPCACPRGVRANAAAGNSKLGAGLCAESWL